MANSEKKLVVLYPEELIFEGNFRTSLKTYLTIYNPHMEKYILYNMKTTAPQLYGVDPSSGVIAPNHSMLVCIELGPFIYSDADSKKGHKFLIQAIQCTESETAVANGNELWQRLTHTLDCWETKIKCVLRYAAAAAAPQAQLEGVTVDRTMASLRQCCGDGKHFGNTLHCDCYKIAAARMNMLQDQLIVVKQEIADMRQSMANVMLQQREKQHSNKCALIVFATVFTMVSTLVGFYVVRHMEIWK